MKRLTKRSLYGTAILLTSDLQAIADKLADYEDAEERGELVCADDYAKLLTAAKAMHQWIFMNVADEQKVYDECGLTDEMNVLLGSVGKPIVIEKQSGRS